MEFTIGERRYEGVMASDLERDGMALEVTDDHLSEVFEIFYSDVTHTMTLTAWQRDIPLDLIIQAIAAAHRRLPPEDAPGRAQDSP